jgi:DNA polymerase III epsilon subunit-like protein
MSKLLCLDCETTGLDLNKHGIVQLAMLMDIDNYLEDSLLVKMQPFEDDWIADSSLNWAAAKAEIPRNEFWSAYQTPTGIPYSEIVNYQLPAEGMVQVITFLDKWFDKFKVSDKAFICGYNVRDFDLWFLKAFFKKNDNPFLGSYINWKCLDPMYILWELDWKQRPGYPLENYKLPTVAKAFDIEHTPHDPMSDIKVTRELWYKLTRSTEIKPCCICGVRGEEQWHGDWWCKLHLDIHVRERQ